jgi:2-polyprenyl-6-methoxyphenol hydroxylase-like FAD-dependent oxidoreductase
MAQASSGFARQGAAFAGQNAVVIGGSMAGLLAARVLADHFTQVTIVERDALTDSTEPRKGVPQGRHGHGLLYRGREIFEELFPDLFTELVAKGAHPVDMGTEMAWHHMNFWRTHVSADIIAYSQSRPMLEATVRARVAALPNVRFLSPCDADALLLNAAGTHVTGVQVQHRDGTQTQTTLNADLVVDASGRGSRMPQLLTVLGYPQVEETLVKVNVAYASRVYRLPAHAAPTWKALMITPDAPKETRLGIMLPMEGDRWIVSLCGWHGDHPPIDEEGFLEWARGLPVPDLYNAIKDAEPLGPAVQHKMPSNQLRHYERMARFPEGLAVLGDALCSFNPTYGQGMTASALDVTVLDACLRTQAQKAASGDITGFADRFRKAVPKAIAVPWMMATGEDFRYPQTEGRRPPGTAFIHWYNTKVQKLTAHDPVALNVFLRVMNLIDAPTAMFAPKIAGRVLRAQFRRKAAAAPAVSTHTESVPGGSTQSASA